MISLIRSIVTSSLAIMQCVVGIKAELNVKEIFECNSFASFYKALLPFMAAPWEQVSATVGKLDKWELSLVSVVQQKQRAEA